MLQQRIVELNVVTGFKLFDMVVDENVMRAIASWRICFLLDATVFAAPDAESQTAGVRQEAFFHRQADFALILARLAGVVASGAVVAVQVAVAVAQVHRHFRFPVRVIGAAGIALDALDVETDLRLFEQFVVRQHLGDKLGLANGNRRPRQQRQHERAGATHNPPPNPTGIAVLAADYTADVAVDCTAVVPTAYAAVLPTDCAAVAPANLPTVFTASLVTNCARDVPCLVHRCILADESDLIHRPFYAPINGECNLKSKKFFPSHPPPHRHSGGNRSPESLTAGAKRRHARSLLSGRPASLLFVACSPDQLKTLDSRLKACGNDGLRPCGRDGGGGCHLRCGYRRR